MPRRQAVEGSVFQTENGRWVAQIELPRQGDGKRRRVFRRTRTRAEAVQLLREMRDEVHRTGTLSSAKRTVKQAVEAHLSARPASDQDAWAARLVVEGLGAFRLADLTVAHCDDFLRSAAAGMNGRRPIGLDQLRKVRQFLAAVLRNEMRVGNLARNVGDLSRLPPVQSSAGERRALDRAELRALLSRARGSRLIIVDLIGRNGLRPAEARGLLWSDLDLNASLLSVSGQLDRQNRRTSPKTKKAARTIQLDGTTVGRLKVWQDEQRELRAKAGAGWHELDIVASSSQGQPVDRHSLARSLRLLCRHAGIDPCITPYELRHTAISMQADAGRSSWELADWAGTSEAMINRVYRHRLRRVSVVLPVDEWSDDE